MLSSEIELADFMASLAPAAPLLESPTKSLWQKQVDRYNAETEQLLTYLRTLPPRPRVQPVRPSQMVFTDRQLEIALAVMDRRTA